MKLIYAERLEIGAAVHRQHQAALPRGGGTGAHGGGPQLLQTLGTRQSDNLLDMAYSLTDEGRRWTIDALERLRYAGPAPVTIGDFCEQVNRQKLTNETITMQRISQAIGDLEMDQSVLEQAGPALNSGRALLLYGPPGQRQDDGGAAVRVGVSGRDLHSLRDRGGRADHPHVRSPACTSRWIRRALKTAACRLCGRTSSISAGFRAVVRS